MSLVVPAAADRAALADLVIIDAPPVESVEGQVVCAVADRALLVIEEGETRAKDATENVVGTVKRERSQA